MSLPSSVQVYMYIFIYVCVVSKRFVRIGPSSFTRLYVIIILSSL